MLQNLLDIIGSYGDVYLAGLWGTLWISFVTVVAGTLLGIVLAALKLTRIRLLEILIDLYIEVIRGTPVLLQLYFFWLFLPDVLQLDMSNTACVVVALIVNSSAYIAEIIRAGIQAVDIGQTEAARSLGMTDFHCLTRIVLPQAVKNILPALGNEFIAMIKETSLASTFFVPELMTAYKTVQSSTFLSVESLMISGLIYLVINFALSRLVKLLEKRLRASDR